MLPLELLWAVKSIVRSELLTFKQGSRRRDLIALALHGRPSPSCHQTFIQNFHQRARNYGITNLVPEHLNTEGSLISINEESSWVQNRHTDVVDSMSRVNSWATLGV